MKWTKVWKTKLKSFHIGTPGSGGLTGKSYQTFKGLILPLNSFCKWEKREHSGTPIRLASPWYQNWTKILPKKRKKEI